MAHCSLLSASGSDVVDVDDVVDVIVLQNDLLAPDQWPFAGGVDRVEGRTEIGVHRLIAVTERHPIAAQLRQAFGLLDDFDIVDVVRGTRLRQAGGARTFGANAEDAVLKPTFVAVPDQRDLALRVLCQRVVVVPGRHPELHVRCIEREPGVPVAVVQVTGLSIEELLSILDAEAGGQISRCGHDASPHSDALVVSAASARCSICCQYLCWTTNSPSSSVCTPLISGFKPIASAESSAPLIQCVAPRDKSFQRAARPRYDIWQERNSSRSSGVAMPLALKKSSYWRMRRARASVLSPFGAMQ